MPFGIGRTYKRWFGKKVKKKEEENALDDTSDSLPPNLLEDKKCNMDYEECKQNNEEDCDTKYEECKQINKKYEEKFESDYEEELESNYDLLKKDRNETIPKPYGMLYSDMVDIPTPYKKQSNLSKEENEEIERNTNAIQEILKKEKQIEEEKYKDELTKRNLEDEDKLTKRNLEDEDEVDLRKNPLYKFPLDNSKKIEKEEDLKFELEEKKEIKEKVEKFSKDT